MVLQMLLPGVFMKRNPELNLIKESLLFQWSNNNQPPTTARVFATSTNTHRNVIRSMMISTPGLWPGTKLAKMPRPYNTRSFDKAKFSGLRVLVIGAACQPLSSPAPPVPVQKSSERKQQKKKKSDARINSAVNRGMT
jgi:hypothetical protein